MKFLFILKDRSYNSDNSKSYGLSNSAWQVAAYLESLGHECKMVSVVDANCIDKEMFIYQPDVVVIEALWVMPAKLNELIELPRYANIQWVVRIHSDIGFLSAETLASTMVDGYIELNKSNLYISTNSKEFNRYYSAALDYDFYFLPNIITTEKNKPPRKPYSQRIDIACFGALRILKNQCFQALCAMSAADQLNKKLYFHITTTSAENTVNVKPNPVLTNLETMFKNSEHELVIHHWMSHEDFEQLISTMDLGLQLSFTESFNIVTADFVNMGVPILVSDAVYWMPWFYKTSTTDYRKVVRKIKQFYRLRNCNLLRIPPRRALRKYNRNAERAWRCFVNFRLSENIY